MNVNVVTLSRKTYNPPLRGTRRSNDDKTVHQRCWQQRW